MYGTILNYGRCNINRALFWVKLATDIFIALTDVFMILLSYYKPIEIPPQIRP
jgi:hypothetical protein